MDKFDAVVIGAGVVGLATAHKLQQHYRQVLLVDKNQSVGEETSSRNSEVIHAGIYYPKDSLKARLCVQGKELLYSFCQQHGVAHKKIGKLIVATDSQEEQQLADILEQAQLNGVDDLTLLSGKQIQAMEPNISATMALYSPSTGIIDSHQYMQALLCEFQRLGGLFVAQTQVEHIVPDSHGYLLSLTSVGQPTTINSQRVVNCAGLHSVDLAKSIDGFPNTLVPRQYFCKGHYFTYSGKPLFQHLVYPVPSQYGLGIHATLDLANQGKFGPDTLYCDAIDYQVPDELKETFYHAIRRYCPSVDKQHLHSGYAGIRPKLQGPGQAFCDFVIQTDKTHDFSGLVQLFGIESPGLTASLAIAEYISEAIK